MFAKGFGFPSANLPATYKFGFRVVKKIGTRVHGVYTEDTKIFIKILC